MRDIRLDLVERLEEARRRRRELEAQLAALELHEQSLKALISQEEQRVRALSSGPTVTTVELPEGARSYRSPLAKFVFECFETQNPVSLHALVDAARKRGISFGDKYPGRVLHSVLRGMKQNGIVERQRDGQWRMIRRFPRLADSSAPNERSPSEPRDS